MSLTLLETKGGREEKRVSERDLLIGRGDAKQDEHLMEELSSLHDCRINKERSQLEKIRRRVELEIDSRSRTKK